MRHVTQVDGERISFEAELDRVFRALRESVLGLFHQIGSDPDKPQELSRRLQINKNLAWKASRLVGAASPSVGMTHIPGPSGLELLLKAFSMAGASAPGVQAVRTAKTRFDRLIEVHAGDRATFDIMLDSMSAGWNSERLEMSRRLAFQGNSGVWGIQTAVRYAFTMLAPSRSDASRVDIGLIGAYIGCRRLRRGVSWPIFKVQAVHNCGDRYEIASPESASGASLPVGRTGLLTHFNSPNTPEIVAVREDDQLIYQLGEGEVGNTARFDCFFGTFLPALAQRYRSDDDPAARVYACVSVPAEELVYDVLVHRDLPYLDDPVAAVYPRLSEKFNPGAPQPLERALPIRKSIERLAAGASGFVSPLVPRHDEVLRTMLNAGKWNADDFTGIRVRLQFPPLPSSLVIEFPLPPPPPGFPPLAC